MNGNKQPRHEATRSLGDPQTRPRRSQGQTRQPETDEAAGDEAATDEAATDEAAKRAKPAAEAAMLRGAPDRRSSERPPEASTKGGGVWQPGPGQLRTCRAPEEQVENRSTVQELQGWESPE
ncbi:unnamed protein product [Arctogadus glacialis]